MRQQVQFGAVHAYRYAATPEPDYALLIVHGIGGHGGTYDVFCEPIARRGAEVFSMDLPGHGKARNENGIWRFSEWLEDIDEAARSIKTLLPGRKVFVLGSSQGSHPAFQSLHAAHAVDGAILMGLAFLPELPPPADTVAGGLYLELTSPAAADIEARHGDARRFELDKVLDWNKNYARDDPDILAKKRKDPLRAWSYGYASLRSYYAYRPAVPASANRKPVLVTVGEKDPLIPASYVEAAFRTMGGPKRLVIVPNGTHQLMLYHTEDYVPLVDNWIREHLQ